jgi:hypothetical protein
MVLAVLNNRKIWQKYVKLSIIKLLYTKLATAKGEPTATNRMVIKTLSKPSQPTLRTNGG